MFVTMPLFCRIKTFAGRRDHGMYVADPDGITEQIGYDGGGDAEMEESNAADKRRRVPTDTPLVFMYWLYCSPNVNSNGNCSRFSPIRTICIRSNSGGARIEMETSGFS